MGNLQGTSFRAIIAAGFLGFLIMFSFPVFGQEPQIEGQKSAAEKKNEPRENSGSEGSHLAEAGKFHFGDDPTIWVLVLLFNLAVAVSIERWWAFRKSRGHNHELVEKITDTITSGGSIANLREDVRDKRFGTEGRVAAAGLRGWEQGEHAIETFAQTSLIAEKRNLEKRLVVLSTLGNNTPFIGLLGTVLGIMKAFRDLAVMGDAGPSVVMKGISEALIATAFGLGVAIPCVIAFNIFNKALKDRVSCAEEISSLLRALRISAGFLPSGNGRGEKEKSPAVSAN